MSAPEFKPLDQYESYSPEAMVARAASLYADLDRRRTVRDFAPDPVPREVIEYCLRIANTAPSGANMQPWHFSVITNPDLKQQVREAAEA
ncbi:MAG: nitroreductase family protein, partial [Pseudomonadota bacterium]